LNLLDRSAILLVSIALSVGLIALLSGFFASRDQGTVLVSRTVTGKRFRDLGDAVLRPGQPRPRYDSNPPTSGAHLPVAVTQDAVRLNEDQVLGALAAGDVVIAYGGPLPPPGLSTLASALAPSFTPALAQAGQAVILDQRPGTLGLIGLAWAHMIRVADASSPSLRAFAAYWLGHGAPRRRSANRRVRP
jgi:Protein of unknown function (DUF3105)